MSKTSKLVAIALIAVVIVAGAGYWLFSPNLTSGTLSYTSMGTSLGVSRRTSEQTPTTNTSSSTAGAAETTLWLHLTATQPLDYYLALPESNRTEPHVSLAAESRKLPDLRNTTAVAKITRNNVPNLTIYSLSRQGVTSSKMKQWLLYS
jgi:hypothetical protein